MRNYTRECGIVKRIFSLLCMYTNMWNGRTYSLAAVSALFQNYVILSWRQKWRWLLLYEYMNLHIPIRIPYNTAPQVHILWKFNMLLLLLLLLRETLESLYHSIFQWFKKWCTLSCIDTMLRICEVVNKFEETAAYLMSL